MWQACKTVTDLTLYTYIQYTYMHILLRKVLLLAIPSGMRIIFQPLCSFPRLMRDLQFSTQNLKKKFKTNKNYCFPDYLLLIN